MKKGNTKSFSKLKCPEKKLNTKSSANNIKNPYNKKYIPESSSNKKSKDFIQQKIKYNLLKQDKKQNSSNYSSIKDSAKNKKENPNKVKKCFQEKRILLNINNLNTTSNNNIYNMNNTNINNTILNTNTCSQNELFTNNNTTCNNNSNKSNNSIFNIDERILLKINKIRLKYEKKLNKDTIEIKNL